MNWTADQKHQTDIFYSSILVYFYTAFKSLTVWPVFCCLFHTFKWSTLSDMNPTYLYKDLSYKNGSGLMTNRQPIDGRQFRGNTWVNELEDIMNADIESLHTDALYGIIKELRSHHAPWMVQKY